MCIVICDCEISDWQLALVIGGIKHEACLLSGIFELGEVNAHEMRCVLVQLINNNLIN